MTFETVSRTLARCLAASLFLLVGCESTDRATTQAAVVSPGAVQLCDGCGEFKGGDACCAADAEKCAGCGMAKGSPGCCTMPKAE